MNLELLQKTADLLRTVPQKQFDIEHWDCGTTACAVGHAVRAGLIPGLVFLRSKSGTVMDLRFGDSVSFDAVARAYGITLRNARFLFNRVNYSAPVTPELVADRIEEFISKRTPTDAE